MVVYKLFLVKKLFSLSDRYERCMKPFHDLECGCTFYFTGIPECNQMNAILLSMAQNPKLIIECVHK